MQNAAAPRGLAIELIYRDEQVEEIIRTELTRSRCAFDAELDPYVPLPLVPDVALLVVPLPVVPLVVPPVVPLLAPDEVSSVPVTSISWLTCALRSLVDPSRMYEEPIPDVPVALVPAVLDDDDEVPDVELLLPVPLCAFVSMNRSLPDIVLDVPLVPVVDPAVLPDVPVVPA